MSTKIEFEAVPESLIPVIGDLVPEKRLYRKDGPEEGAGPWFDALNEHFDGLISPGGAGMYAPVGRAAVHKRIKEGNLTCFAYYVTESRRTFFGTIKKKREKPYLYILVSELKQWAQEIQEQAVKLGKVTREELEGKEPDHEGEFLEYESKWSQKLIVKSAGKRRG